MIKDKLGKKLIIFDGAMGTELQKSGLKTGEVADLWNILNPKVIKEVHKNYLNAGCDVIKTCTFNCNTGDLKANNQYSITEITKTALKNAKDSIEEVQKKNNQNKPRYIALDIGPTGKLLKPLGDLDFEDAVSIFSETVKAGSQAGADLILIETMSDAYELKAAVLAAKENCNLPVIASVTLDEKGKLLTGGGVDVVVSLLEGLGVDAIGFNCGFGPVQWMPHVDKLLELTSLPVLFMPNAGLPIYEDGKIKYDITPSEFAQSVKKALYKGVWLLGGCCGTTPDHINQLFIECEDMNDKIPPVSRKTNTIVSSYSKTIVFGNKKIIVGERINPTGKPKLKKALKEDDYEYALCEGIVQSEQGADALDVNAGVPGIDEKEVLANLVQKLQAVLDLPLQIDSADPHAMEKALRVYNGKPIINSVNGKKSNMDAVFPLVKKYGGVVVALTLDEDGIPETADGRIAIAKKILLEAAQYGIGKDEFLFDSLTMAVSAGQNNALITLECVKRLKEELKVKTILGVSNISFGLPNREILNNAFLSLAFDAGLDAAIFNPAAIKYPAAEQRGISFSRGIGLGFNTLMIAPEGRGIKPSPRIKDDLTQRRSDATEEEKLEIAKNALLGKDEQFTKYIEVYGNQQEIEKDKNKNADTQSNLLSLNEAVLKGLKQQALEIAKHKLTECDPLKIIDNELIPALNIAGEKFEKGTMYLPQLLMCAEAAKTAFTVIRESIDSSKNGSAENDFLGTIVIATVEGDIHDIGKNIVRAILENYRFKVIDLGKDVPVMDVVESVKKHNAKLVGLSALMTTTVASMERTITALREAKIDCKIICGGAVLTEDYAKQIGADFYAKDAMAAVRYAQEVFGKIG